MLKRLLSFIKKEFLHIFRDRRTMLILIGMPMVQILLFGFAISTEINNINFAVYAPDFNNEVRRITDKIGANGYFTSIGRLDTPEDIDRVLVKGDADAVIRFDTHFGNGGNDNLNIDIIVNSSDPNMGSVSAMYVNRILQDYYAGDKMDARVNITSNFLYNPQMKSSYNFVPGIMGLILLIICTVMTSVSIVREKETGSMEVLLVSPTRPINIIIAKMVPYLTLSVVNLFTILLLAVTLLELPVTGSFVWVILVSVIYIIIGLALGLLISTLMYTQVSAMLFSLMVMMLPTILLSGLIYPRENMPYVLQWLSCIVPATWYISSIKKLMIEGVPLHYVMKEIIIMLFMALFIITVSVKKFKNRLE